MGPLPGQRAPPRSLTAVGPSGWTGQLHPVLSAHQPWQAALDEASPLPHRGRRQEKVNLNWLFIDREHKFTICRCVQL